MAWNEMAEMNRVMAWLMFLMNLKRIGVMV
jgi:hypothetical protein